MGFYKKKTLPQVAHGDSNSILLPEMACPQPPPSGHQLCSLTDCPTQWQTSPWTKVTPSYSPSSPFPPSQCSRRCGGGSRIESGVAFFQPRVELNTEKYPVIFVNFFNLDPRLLTIESCLILMQLFLFYGCIKWLRPPEDHPPILETIASSRNI